VRGDFMYGETFKHKLKNRCTMFRYICKSFMDKLEKETANA